MASFGKLPTGVLNGLDKGVRNVVADLNAHGQITAMSCQGHKNQKSITGIRKDGTYIHSAGRGWISFFPKGFNETIARNIMKKHGLKRITFYTYPYKKELFSAILPG